MHFSWGKIWFDRFPLCKKMTGETTEVSSNKRRRKRRSRRRRRRRRRKRRRRKGRRRKGRRRKRIQLPFL